MRSTNQNITLKTILHSILLATFLSLSTISVQAQTWGLRAGLNLSKMQIKDNLSGNYTSLYKTQPGAHLGLSAEVTFNDYLSLETGLYFNQRGFGSESENYFGGGTYTQKTRLYYSDIPVFVKGSYPFNDDLKMFGQAGPYFGVGLYGKTRIEGYNGEKEEYEIEFGNDPLNNQIKRIDWGFTFGAGVQWKPFVLGIYYDLGMFNMAPDQTYFSTTYKTRVLRFSLGWNFKEGKKKE